MFKALFLVTLSVTLVVNIIFLFATKDKPPDLSTSTFVSIQHQTKGNHESSSQRRLLIRSNDFYDYSPTVSTNLNISRQDLNLGSERGHDESSRGQSMSENVKQTPESLKQRPKLQHNQLSRSRLKSRDASRDTMQLSSPISALFDNSRNVAGNKERDDQAAQRMIVNLSNPIPTNDRTTNRPADFLSTEQLNHLEKIIHHSTRLAQDIPIQSKDESDKQFGTAKSINIDMYRSADKSEENEISNENLMLDINGSGVTGASAPAVTDSIRDSVSRQQSTNLRRPLLPNAKLISPPNTRRLPEGSRSSLRPDSSGDAGGINEMIPLTNTSRTLNIRVKSSKNHVFVSVGNNVIYESKARMLSLPNSKRLKDNSANYQTRRSPNKQQSQHDDASGRNSMLTSTAPTVSDDLDDSESRGIHVVVLNQFDGYVMSKRVFDTYSPGQDEELCFYLNMVRDGRILVLAVQDEASFKMAADSPARELLVKLGSRSIMNLRWRDMWALVIRKELSPETNARIGVSPRRVQSEFAERVNLAEGLTKSHRFADWAEPLILDTQVELLEPKFKSQNGMSNDCFWRTDNRQEDERRFDFCSRVEGYGSVCDCHSPAPISFEPIKIENSQLDRVPLIVMAGNRPQYLYRMLRTLLDVDGVDPALVTVFIDGFYDEPLMVCRLLNLRAIQQAPMGYKSSRISHHYKFSLTAAFELYPQSEFAIILEEDLDIAKDALVYFNQTLTLLKKDPSLYCVSAWNDQGYEHTSGDNGLIYRVETMPGLGWMLSRQLYKDELELNWPSADQPHDWDMWIRTQSIRKGRECLIPDISRTFHFGSRGTNINSYFQRQYFSKHAFNLNPIDEFANLDQLTRESYEESVEKLISAANIIRVVETANVNHTRDYLCSLADIDHQLSASNLQDKSLTDRKTSDINSEQNTEHNVIYIDMIDNRDFNTWLELAKCWHIWDLDARGQHNSMWRLFLNGRATFVIGVPASPYSKFKPIELVPYKL